MAIKNDAIVTPAHFVEAIIAANDLLDRLSSSLYYHGKAHTFEYVLPAALTIAEKEGFSLEDILLVGIAAVFHDTGFVKQYNANEPIGAKFAEKYMRKSQYAYTEEQVQDVKDAIENTSMKNPPQTKYARVLRDADLSTLGHRDFLELNIDLWRECFLAHPESPLHVVSLDKSLWAKSTLTFMTQSHTWFTQSARAMYEEAKQQNIDELKKHFHIE